MVNTRYLVILFYFILLNFDFSLHFVPLSIANSIQLTDIDSVCIWKRHEGSYKTIQNNSFRPLVLYQSQNLRLWEWQEYCCCHTLVCIWCLKFSDLCDSCHWLIHILYICVQIKFHLNEPHEGENIWKNVLYPEELGICVWWLWGRGSGMFVWVLINLAFLYFYSFSFSVLTGLG
jgi:hypothetical protein